MLILARGEGERVRLLLPSGEEIWITLLQIRSSHQVRLGIQAPEGVAIEREEIIPCQPPSK